MIKTVSLETAKKLKDAGFEKETERRWVHLKSKKTVMESKIDTWKCLTEDWDVDKLGYAAPNTDELLENIPHVLQHKRLTIRKYYNAYGAGYMMDEGWIECFEAKELPEVLALLWLFLKKEGLLEAKNV